MSNIKLDIQKFAGGGADWSAGVTRSAIESALESFNAAIVRAQEAILNTAAVDGALKSGWSGTDCEVFLEKFHQHATEVTDNIEKYRVAVTAEAEKIIGQWEEFQANLIS